MSGSAVSMEEVLEAMGGRAEDLTDLILDLLPELRDSVRETKNMLKMASDNFVHLFPSGADDLNAKHVELFNKDPKLMTGIALYGLKYILNSGYVFDDSAYTILRTAFEALYVWGYKAAEEAAEEAASEVGDDDI